MSSPRPLGSVDSTIFMSDLYDMQYNLYDHSGNRSRPLASVAVLPGESCDVTFRVNTVISEYLKHDILGLFGITLSEYFNLSRAAMNVIIKQSETENTRRSDLLADIKP